MARRPQLRSPLARAIVPVAIGVIGFAVLGLALWAVAALISNGDNTSNLLAARTFSPGPASGWADVVQRDGPIIFPDLLGTDGDRTIVLDHIGADPRINWRIFLAHPADRPLSCKVTQVQRTRTFADCAGRSVSVDALAKPAAGIAPVVSGDGILSLIVVPSTTTQPTAPPVTTQP